MLRTTDCSVSLRVALQATDMINLPHTTMPGFRGTVNFNPLPCRKVPVAVLMASSGCPDGYRSSRLI